MGAARPSAAVSTESKVIGSPASRLPGHGGGSHRFHAEDPDRCVPRATEGACDATDLASSAHRNDDVEGALEVFSDLQARGSVAGDDRFRIEGMEERHPPVLGDAEGLLEGLRCRTVKDHLAAVSTGRLRFEKRGRRWA